MNELQQFLDYLPSKPQTQCQYSIYTGLAYGLASLFNILRTSVHFVSILDEADPISGSHKFNRHLPIVSENP
jgi:hypothetical protein